MKKGFTLLELIIVVIIIGILAAVALPRFIGVAIRARSGEGLSILATYRDYQMRYYTQWSAYSSTADCSKLDVSSTNLKNFTSVACYSAAANIVKVFGCTTFINADYGINGDGVITCNGSDCARTGY